MDEIIQKCSYCFSSSLYFLFDAKDIASRSFGFTKCNNCKTVQIDFFDQQVLNYAYKADYYGGVNAKFKIPFNLLFSLSKKSSAKFIDGILKNKESHILDIGCGRAELLIELNSRGYKNVFGNDIERPKNIPDFIRFFEGSFNPTLIKGKQFDFVSLFHVFEHLPDPKEVLNNINNVISKDGYLYITIPNVNSKQFDKYGANWFHLDPPRHLHLIPPTELVQLLQDKGYTLISEQSNFLFYNVIGYSQSQLNSWLSKRDYFYEFLKNGHRIKSINEAFILALSFIFTSLSFPFYVLSDLIDRKRNKAATIGLLFRKS